MQTTTGDHVAFEVEKELEVGSCACAGGEEDGISREEGFREEEECDREGERSADCTEPVVPSPSFCLA